MVASLIYSLLRVLLDVMATRQVLMTLDTYTHVTDSLSSQAADTIDALPDAPGASLP